MQSLNPLAAPAAAPLTSQASRTAPVADTAATPAAGAVAATPGVDVTLSDPDSIELTQTYTPDGALANTTSVWERDTNDAISRLMSNNYQASTLGDRFKGLGAALLQHLQFSGADYSQSVILRSASSSTDASVSSLDQARQTQLHAVADNQVSLDIKTAGGATVHLSLTSHGGNLGVQIRVTNGSLSATERNAIAGLADAFQAAVDGLTAVPPKLALEGLTQFDTSVLSSVDLDTSFKQVDGSVQTLAFHADSKQRSVSYTGAAGTINVDVDMSHTELIGSADQQSRALAGYLQQFDQAQSRGQGKAELMTMFKDAFSTLNSNYVADASNFTRPTVSLSDMDHAMLTGLADFSASVTDSTGSINPLHPEELDAFSYEVSQHTEVKGGSAADRSIEQTQQSQLGASYHQGLYPDTPLNLTADAYTQNYYYYQIQDSSSSVATIAYNDGVLAKASITQSANQSTRIRKYIQAELQEDLSTPSSVSRSWNLLELLDSAKPKDGNSTPQDIARWHSTLSSISDFAVMKADPTRLRGSGLFGAVEQDVA